MMMNETKTLRDEITAAHACEYNSSKWYDIRTSLEQLAEDYGLNATGPWALVRTAFHGGGLISTHKTATRAVEKARQNRSDCTCGCVVVVLASKLNDLPTADATQNPYAGAR